MPIDPTEPAPTATGTNRRAFLTRTAAGGALVATAASTGLAGGLGGLHALVPAGAQDGVPVTVLEQFATVATGYELGAGLAYQAALSEESLSEEWAIILRQFQRNHQDVAALLDGLRPADADAVVADGALTRQFSPPAGADEESILSVLASLEEAMAATHLSAIALLGNAGVAKIVAQAMAVEQQQAVFLGRASGVPIAELTPATATTDGALIAGDSFVPADPVEEAATQNEDENLATDSGEIDSFDPPVNNDPESDDPAN